ncbi:UPF0481 protein At3g47200-like [Quercus robur]|uniref:UPF0481 protein At3g47200-like n=1 Tax=Quercus robur TaxID=38942 RepID=UPI00216360F2|nr:UPF0481 protein At3g47200-like [Quercus robur]
MEDHIAPSEQRGGEEYSIKIPPPAQQVEPEKRRECCIYKVPLKLRKVNEDAYTPKLISIGPYHYGQENLNKMEDLKRRYFWDACVRTKKSEEDFSRRIQEHEYQKILHCYADDSHVMKEEDFMTMILLDSIFIIEELWRTNENPPMSPPAMTTISQKCEWRMWGACVINFQKERKEDNPEKKNHEKENPWRSYNIMQDLLLLENQVPFFVLEDLYEFAYSDLFMYPQNEDNSFRRHVHEYFFHFWEISGFVRDSDYEKIFASKKKEVKHFTDFLRYFLLPHNPTCGRSFARVPCATNLSEAGVEFKVSKSENGRLLDIQFRKSALLEICPFVNMSWFLSCFPCFPRFKCLENAQTVLELKSFIIGDATECAVRNLMALEQCHYPREAYICNYIILWDNLINTEEDVDLLVEKKVIVNWLGDNKAVATLINKLREQIVEANHTCYWELSKKIQGHYDNVWSKVMASFTTLYFKDFWRGTATVVGIMVLFFSFWNFLKPFVFPT